MDAWADLLICFFFCFFFVVFLFINITAINAQADLGLMSAHASGIKSISLRKYTVNGKIRLKGNLAV